MPQSRLLWGLVVCSASVLAATGCGRRAEQVPTRDDAGAPAVGEADEEPAWIEDGP
jgi:hypothetical protein